MKKIACLFVLCFFAITTSIAQPLSETVFQNPPSSYGVSCFWWWLNGNTDKETITRELEEMKAKGFFGAMIFDAGGAAVHGNFQVPEGPMFGSPEWRELFFHAVKEAERLGLTLSMSITSGWNIGAPDVTVEETAKQVTFSEITIKGPRRVIQALPKPESNLDFYRDIVTVAFPAKTFTDRLPIRDFKNKISEKEVGASAPETSSLLRDFPGTLGEEDAKIGDIIDLTKFAKDGYLEWQAPPSDWIVLRIGYTTTGPVGIVKASSGQWQGRIIDYMSRKHFNRYWDTHIKPLLDMIGPAAGKTMRYVQSDSFEAGGMNWTEGFENEFRKRRGYDPLPFLPVLTGKIIENREKSACFLNDFRKTLGELISENHYQVFAERAAEYGIGTHPESSGPHAGPFDGLNNYAHGEIVMSEFWSPSPHRPKPNQRFFVKQAGSAAKIYDKQLVAAEAFTTQGPHWNDVVWSDMKPAVDHEFCSGLNMLFLHTFTTSPKSMGLPGQEYAAGTHFNTNVTWWDYSGEFIRYLSRCAYLLRQGRSHADVLYYYGDHVPNIGRYKEDDPAGALPWYDYDLINEDRLLALEAKDGKIVLPSGASYRVLVIPDFKVLSLRALQKAEKLVEAGAVILGPKPTETGSLTGGEQADATFRKTVDKLWGANPPASGTKKTGKGTVVWGQKAGEYLRSNGVLPDCEINSETEGATYDYIHRIDGETDIYFISNRNSHRDNAYAAFRVTGKQPELWNPVTGETKKVRATIAEGRTIVPLEFDPYGSCFVVFRDKMTDPTQKDIRNARVSFAPVTVLNNRWEVFFDPKRSGPGKVTFDELTDWTKHPNEGIKYYSGIAVYSTSFDLPDDVASNMDRLWLDLGKVKDVGIARVKLNGKDLGIVWTPPFRVPLKDVKQKDNRLEIEVVNTWRNRLIGDNEKPENERVTKTNIVVQYEWEYLAPTMRNDWVLLPSGLLGPVAVLLKDND